MRLKSYDHFDFRKRVAYYPEQKRLFHRASMLFSTSSAIAFRGFD
jgi:hypothetical protein